MRGKACFMLLKDCIAGITPAYAGKSPCWRLNHLRCRDHPRLCGEKAPARLLVSLPSGSPPPMRGKASDSVYSPRRTGITPAYAGKRKSGLDSTKNIRDHPRLCGEKFRSKFVLSRCKGSPPPMRGKELLEALEDTDDRITPAYAGKRKCRRCPIWYTGDHPRLCGEKYCVGCVSDRYGRITPAYAGKRDG